jgi:hypothetical protein
VRIALPAACPAAHPGDALQPFHDGRIGQMRSQRSDGSQVASPGPPLLVARCCVRILFEDAVRSLLTFAQGLHKAEDSGSDDDDE